MRFDILEEEEAPVCAYWGVQDVQKARTDPSPGRRRFRAPSSDSSTTSSDEEDAVSDSELEGSDRDVHAATSALATLQLTAKSRQELVKQVERACERKAVLAVTGSDTYQTLCEKLQRARQDAEAALSRLDRSSGKSGDDMDVLRKQQQLEREATAKLQQLRLAKKIVDERRSKENVRKLQHDVKKKHALQEAKAKEEALEAQRKAEQEVEEAQAKAKAQAAERAAAQKKQEAQREKEQAATKAAEKEAAAKAKKYVEDGHKRIKRLEELHRHTTEILDSPDPAVKKIRMQIRRE
ncbi:hypothetical protein PHPALM_14849, partial [Phytophthora palmivora]